MGAVRVYTVCDESRYMVVRNVPALGCGDDLMSLFTTYGEVEEFAKRKLDESFFLGNRLQISYAPEFETLSDTKDKLETRRKDVLLRSNQYKLDNSVDVSSCEQARKPPKSQNRDNISPQKEFGKRDGVPIP